MSRMRKNQRGSALLAGMIGAFLVAGAATVAYQNYGVTQSSVRAARVRNMMSVVEAQVRRRALQPEAYVGCDSQGGVANCNINNSYFSDLAVKQIIGAKCEPAGSPCGIQVTGVTLLKPSREFRANISYNGKDASLKPVDVSLVVPVEILQNENFNCGDLDPARPIFAGFDANGRPDCRGFNACGAHQFISGIDVANHTVTCSNLPTSVACGSDQLFDLFNWNGGAVNHRCISMPDPPFRSALVARRAASSPPPDMTPPLIVGAATTVTTTYTASAPAPAPAPAPTPTPSAALKWVRTGTSPVSNGPGGTATNCPNAGGNPADGVPCSTAGATCYWAFSVPNQGAGQGSGGRYDYTCQ